MSRLRLTFALAVLVALAAALAACGGDSDGSDESPQAVIEKATFKGIESADVDLSLEVESTGEEGADLDVTVSGPFKGEGEDALPQLDIDVEASGKVKGDDVDVDAGLVLLPNSAYVGYEGTEYEVDPTTFSFVESALNQSQGGEGESSGATACQEAAGEFNVASLAGDLENEGSADVGGTSTTKLSGEVDVPGAFDTLIELSEDPACSAQLEAGGPIPSPEELKQSGAEIKRAVKTARLDLYVGEDDIVRRLVLDLLIEPQGAKKETVQIDLDLTLNGVNEDQEISVPENAKPLSDLFLKLNLNPLELAGALQGGEGLGGLLKGLGDSTGLGFLGGEDRGGGNGGSGNDGGGASGQSYSDCIRNAASAVELQRCVSKL